MKYKKKPLEVEARQFTAKSFKAIEKWTKGRVFQFMKGVKGQPDKCIVRTLEGNLYANSGDYIVKGIKGEFYPVAQDIFESSYDKVEKPKAKKDEKKSDKAKG